MKARLLRDEEITHPRLKSVADVVAWRKKLDLEEISPQEWRAGMFLQVKAGTVVDHPHAHRLVLMGMAEPYDQECKARCERLNVDVDLTAEAQDRVRQAQLTGDPAYDRDAGDELHDELADLDALPAPEVVGNDVLAVPLPKT
jgi:hypothetical protein